MLEGGTGGLGAEGLAEDDDALAGSHDGSLDHEEVFVDDSVVGESSDGGDGLLGEVELGGGVVVHFATWLR